jgi:hypothetical protein
MKKTVSPNVIRIESSSYAGQSWIAQIAGIDNKFGLARDFYPKRDVTTSRSNKYRQLEWLLDRTPGMILEYRDLDSSSSGGSSGFWRIRPDGEFDNLTRAEVVEEFKK